MISSAIIFAAAYLMGGAMCLLIVGAISPAHRPSARSLAAILAGLALMAILAGFGFVVGFQGRL